MSREAEKVPAPRRVDDQVPRKTRASLIWKIITIILGVTLILAGIVLSLPFVPGPGVLAILAGLAVLSPHSRWARWILEKLKERFRRLTKRKTGAADDPQRADDFRRREER